MLNSICISMLNSKRCQTSDRIQNDLVTSAHVQYKTPYIYHIEIITFVILFLIIGQMSRSTKRSYHKKYSGEI